jgi:uncharacterized damage-inducible protein DinB
MSPEAAAAPAGDPIALLFPDLEGEIATTRAMLAAVPFDKFSWKPHAKSMSLAQLATHVAQLPSFATAIIAMDELVFDPTNWQPAVVEGTDALVALFDSEVVTMKGALAALDWAKLNGTWRMVMNGQAVISGQRASLIRKMGINHLVHHRAQLGVYLRLLDVKIPGSYGPSADS